MLLLTQNRSLSVENICQELCMSKRSIYRYIDAFRDMGFKVIKEGTRYRLDHDSPFFRSVTDKIHFSEDEAMTINQVLNAVYDNSPQIRHLRNKLQSLYDYKVSRQDAKGGALLGVDDIMAHNLSVLYDAIRLERVVVLRKYVSPSSGKVSNRIVEPYLFLAENSEVRCYEIATGENKTFKISRARSIEMLDLLWMHKDQHTALYTDLFHFSGEEKMPVQLLLGPLASSLLIEECPNAELQMTLQPDGRHLLTTEVCSYKGVGRFVLGLFDDIEVVDSPEFEKYLHERVALLTQKFSE